MFARGTSSNYKLAYYKPLGIALIISAVGCYYCIRPAKEPFLIFVSTWCVIQAYGVLSNLNEQLRFYEWWHVSELSDSQTRGLGTNGFPLFGFIPLPSLSPLQLRIVSLCYATGLISCAYFTNSSFVGYMFLAVLVLGLFYFSSLWAERNASYHREYLTVALLFYFCLTPQFYGFKSSSLTIVFLIQLHVASVYVAGALQKTVCSVLAKRPWFTCAPHSFIWRAMWSKPYYGSLQRYFFSRPKLVAASSFIVLMIELFFFFQFQLPNEARLAMITCMILFHVSVFVLQGIDYLTFWSPVFLLWFIVPDSQINWLEIFASWLYAPAILFCFAQLIYAFTFIEDFNINIPPFTCCPMFVNVCGFNERVPQYYCMWDMRSPIPVERLEWTYPFVKTECGLGLVKADIAKMPFRFVGFGHYVGSHRLPALQKKWFHSELVGEDGFFVLSNYVVDASLVNQLRALVVWLHEEMHEKSIYDRDFLDEAIARYEVCHRLFIDGILKDPALQYSGDLLPTALRPARVYGAKDVAIA